MASQHLHKKEGTKQALTAISTIPRIPPIQTATTGFVTVIQLTTDLLSRELCFRLDSKSSPPPLFYFTECLTFHCLFLSFMSGHVWNVLKLLITFLFFFFYWNCIVFLDYYFVQYFFFQFFFFIFYIQNLYFFLYSKLLTITTYFIQYNTINSIQICKYKVKCLSNVELRYRESG